MVAIQSCGGQMTADGSRSRTGGGILWRIIKAREPKAYKVIMNKAKEFEVCNYSSFVFIFMQHELPCFSSLIVSFPFSSYLHMCIMFMIVSISRLFN